MRKGCVACILILSVTHPSLVDQSTLQDEVPLDEPVPLVLPPLFLQASRPLLLGEGDDVLGFVLVPLSVVLVRLDLAEKLAEGGQVKLVDLGSEFQINKPVL